MTDVASLGFAIDSSQAVKATGDLDKLSASANRVQGAANKTGAASKGLAADQKLLGAEAQRTAAQFSNATPIQDKHTSSLLGSRMQLRALSHALGNHGSEMSELINKTGLLYLATRHVSVGLVAAVFSLGLFTLAARKLVDIIKEAAEISHSAQFAEMGGQNIQGLIAAAGFKGVGSDVMLKSMVGLNQQVNLAKSGLGTLSVLFRANGVAATTTEEAFFKIADLVKNARNEAEKFSIIQQAGLPVSNQMVVLLSQGADAIRKQADEAKKLTNQQLEDAKHLEEQWHEAWTNFERWGKSAIVATAEFMRGLGDIGSPPGGTARRPLLPSQRISRAFSELEGHSTSPVPQITVNANPTVNPEFLKQQLELEKQRITILGQTASVTKEVRLAEIDLQIAGINGAGVTKAQRDSLLDLARERALGITGIKAQIDSTNVQAATIFMGAGAAAEYTAKQTLLNEAIRNHKVLTESDIAAIDAQAKALGTAAAALDQMKKINDAGGAFFSGFVTDLSHGVKAAEALRNALTRLADTLIDMATRKLWQAALGSFMGSFGGASAPIGSVGGNSIYSAGGLSPLDAAVRHGGGMADFGGSRRYVSPAYFDNAPRFGRGGIVGGEVPVIAHRGERVSTPEQWAAQGNSGGVTVSIVLNAQGAGPNEVQALKAEVAQLKSELPGIVLKANYEAKRRSVRT